MNTVELVNLAIAGDRDSLMAALDNAMAVKVTDALEIKKIEIASNLLGTEETDEVTNATLEVDGTDGSTNIQSEPATADTTTTEQN
jgi:hypothetical protein